jgi:hypothetical protein
MMPGAATMMPDLGALSKPASSEKPKVKELAEDEWRLVEANELPLLWRDSPPNDEVWDPPERPVHGTMLQDATLPSSWTQPLPETSTGPPFLESSPEKKSFAHDPVLLVDAYDREIIEPEGPLLPKIEPETDEVGWGFKAEDLRP